MYLSWLISLSINWHYISPLLRIIQWLLLQCQITCEDPAVTCTTYLWHCCYFSAPYLRRAMYTDLWAIPWTSQACTHLIANTLAGLSTCKASLQSYMTICFISLGSHYHIHFSMKFSLTHFLSETQPDSTWLPPPLPHSWSPFVLGFACPCWFLSTVFITFLCESSMRTRALLFWFIP